MKKALSIILVGVLLLFCTPAFSADVTEVEQFYSPATPDYQVTTKNQVEVEQSRVVIVKQKYTLLELDYYIKSTHAQIKESREQLEKLIALRNIVEAEASKVKLKDGKGL